MQSPICVGVGQDRAVGCGISETGGGGAATGLIR
jgi:hypothetical protein